MTNVRLFKETPEDEAVRAEAFRVTAAELRGFVENYERLNSEKAEIAETQKEVMAEAKSRGYSVKAIKKIVAERKREPADVQEEQAILDLYRSALGM